MVDVHSCEIVENSPLCADVRKLVFRSAELAAALRPGQFMMLRCGGADALLRRPFCASGADASDGSATILYQVRGKGTARLAQMRAGGALDVLGPLGNGFGIDGFVSGAMRRAAIIGGGIGAFPLLFLARALRQMRQAGTEGACASGGAAEADVWLGFRDGRFAAVARLFEGCADKLRVASDDGSFGAKGLAPDVFAADLRAAGMAAAGAAAAGAAAADAPLPYDAVFACGPEPMLEAVQGICAKHGLRAQLCVEQRMACGVGACYVCACADVHGGYRRVCRDGPVFMADEIVF